MTGRAAAGPERDAAAMCLARSRESLASREFESAEIQLREALALQPDLSEAYELLGKLLYRDGRAAQAAALYRDWQRALPDNPIAAHLVAATGGSPPPARASNAFITSLYQRAAPQFDSTADSLGYRAPQLLCTTLAEALGPDWRRARVLDLGCGTGLCGTPLRPHAVHLVGVDLSSEMLERARQRGCYDELTCAEVMDFLDHCLEPRDSRFEVVTAADVFCYFGELVPVFTGIGRILSPDGCFVFSVEALEDQPGAPRVSLQEHGRYAHSLEYLHHALGEAGLAARVVRDEMLRFERGAPVQGWVVLARVPQ